MIEHGSVKEVARHLSACGGYRDLDKPVIVTSGAFLTPFFVNAEKLCGDPEIGEFLTTWAGDDEAVVRHAVRLSREDREFSRDIDALCEVVEQALGSGDSGTDGDSASVDATTSATTSAMQPAISGGQRRDWIFSGPVAQRLGLPHISLYKQKASTGAAGDRVVLRIPGRAPRELGDPALRGLRGLRVVHVVDMITAASSCFSHDPVTGRDLGWIPLLRERGASISDLVSVVTRLQGGEENLRRRGVDVHALVTLDERFLRSHSKFPEDAAAYLRDPAQWSRSWLREHGPGILMGYLEDEAGKLPRLVKFIRIYRSFLRQQGFLEELHDAARRRLGAGAAAELVGEAGAAG